LAILGLVLGTMPFSPTVSAKTKYKTLLHNEKIEKMEDFAKGEMKNVQMKKTDRGVEFSLEEGERGEYITPEISVPFKAMFVGLHWQEETADENLLTAYVRAREDGKPFSEWVKTSVN